jgi:hypothetical protein
VVLDGVVGASGQHLGHFGPLAAVGGVGEEEDPLLMQHPLHLQDGRVQVVVPPLATLLAQTALDELGDEGPPLRTVLLDELAHQAVLLLRPGLLSQEFGLRVVGLHGGVVVVLLGHRLLLGLLHHLLKFELVVILKITARAFKMRKILFWWEGRGEVGEQRWRRGS